MCSHAGPDTFNMAAAFVHILPSSPQLRSDPPVILCEVGTDMSSATFGEIPDGTGRYQLSKEQPG